MEVSLQRSVPHRPLGGAAPSRSRTGWRPTLRLAPALLGLVLAGLLPALGIGGIAVWQAAKGWQEAAGARLHDTARALSLAVAGEIERHRSAAAVLALSDSLKAAEPDFWAFDAQARRAGTALGAQVVLLDPRTNRQLVNTALPPIQSEIRSRLDIWPDQEAGRLATGGPGDSNLVTGSLLGRPVVGVAAPVMFDGRARFTLAVLLRPERLNGLLGAQTLPGTSFAVLMDGKRGVITASAGTSTGTSARAPGADLAGLAGRGDEQAAQGGAGLRSATGSDGLEWTYAFLPVDGTPGWRLAVAQLASEFNEAWRRPLLILTFGGLGALAVAGTLASLTARSVLEPLALLSRRAQAFAEGGPGAPADAAPLPPAEIAELEALRRGFGTAEARLAAREAALAESKFRFRAVSAAVPALLFAADAGGCVTYASERFQGYTGVAAAGLLDCGWLRVLHPLDCDRAAAAWSQALRSGQPFETEFRVRAADGGYRWFLGRGAPMRDEAGRDETGRDGSRRDGAGRDGAGRDGAGRIVGWFGACTDIQDIADAREVLTRDKDELEHLVDARTHDLQDAQGRLMHAQRMEAVGRLTAGVAHDFNNVLLTLMSGLEFALDDGTDPAEAREDLQIALSAAQRGARLTSHLLSFSRQQVLRPAPVDVSLLLHELRHTLARTLGRDVLLRVEAEPGLHALVDADHLNSALLNLSLNARDAMPDGGVITLEAHALAPGMDAGARGSGAGASGAGARVVVAVADTGEGMTADVRAKACEPFFSTKGLKGSGLGLSMVQGFAAQSGGAFHLHSEVGQGTRVELHLPQGAAPAGGVPGGARACAVPAPGGRP